MPKCGMLLLDWSYNACDIIYRYCLIFLALYYAYMHNYVLSSGIRILVILFDTSVYSVSKHSNTTDKL